MSTEDLRKLDNLLEHIRHVQEAAAKIGRKMIEKGGEDAEFGRILIARSMLHDNTKFFGIEWDNLAVASDKKDGPTQLAIDQHVKTNAHHPEYWGGINNMPEICIAEMCCDWWARSVEFGTDLRQWIEESATEKYSFTMQTKKGKEIKKYLDLLLEKPFKG